MVLGRAGKERRHNVLWIAWGGGTNWRIRSDQGTARLALLGVELDLKLESIKMQKVFKAASKKKQSFSSFDGDKKILNYCVK